MDTTTHRPEYLRLAKRYLAGAKEALLGLHERVNGFHGIMAKLETVKSPGSAPNRLQEVGWALADNNFGGWAYDIGSVLREIGECCMRGGYTDESALTRLREYLEELEEMKRP